MRVQRPEYPAAVKVSLAFVGLALACLAVADLSISTLDPWTELQRMAWGLLTPDFLAIPSLWDALLKTVSFALCGVALGASAGFLLALAFHWGPVRWLCAFVRAVHEIFWAFILLQIFGLTPLTGILAIAIPYAGICAKVYSETLEEAPAAALALLPAGSSRISAFFFVRLPDVWVHIKNYTSYRFECGLRSSAVLGFIGLPTLGFHLETAFGEGLYSEAAALLIIFYLLIATLRYWMRPRLLPLYVLAAPFLLGAGAEMQMSNLLRFFTQDIIPAPLRNADLGAAETWQALAEWLQYLWSQQALPGMIATVVLTQIALVATGLLALGFFPLISRQFMGPVGRRLGHVFLVVLRSTPEFILAYVFLQLWGPSMLPAVVALALHNGAIIGHLLGRYSDQLRLRPDASRGINRYGYEILPRLYGQYLAFLFYRWEIIMRETAILGILGIATLGFYIDSALSEIRLDRVVLLILFTATLNIGIDSLSRQIRQRLRLSHQIRET